MTLVPTGPLTNIALLLARYPGIEARIERIVLMGGSIGEGNVTPAAEFNIWADPEAAHRVFSTDVDLTMVGLDVTHQALLTPDHLEVLEVAGAPGKLVADLYRFFLSIHGDRYGWVGAPVHDAVAVAHVIDGSLLETTRCGGDDRHRRGALARADQRRRAPPDRSGCPCITSRSTSTPTGS